MYLLSQWFLLEVLVFLGNACFPDILYLQDRVGTGIKKMHCLISSEKKFDFIVSG